MKFSSSSQTQVLVIYCLISSLKLLNSKIKWVGPLFSAHSISSMLLHYKAIHMPHFGICLKHSEQNDNVYWGAACYYCPYKAKMLKKLSKNCTNICQNNWKRTLVQRKNHFDVRRNISKGGKKVLCGFFFHWNLGAAQLLYFTIYLKKQKKCNLRQFLKKHASFFYSSRLSLYKTTKSVIFLFFSPMFLIIWPNVCLELNAPPSSISVKAVVVYWTLQHFQQGLKSSDNVANGDG